MMNVNDYCREVTSLIRRLTGSMYLRPPDVPADNVQGGGLTEKLGSPPTDLQKSIWEALKGRALMKTTLAKECNLSDESNLYATNRKNKTGGLTELRKIGLVVNKPTIGYYRPDAPPNT